MTFTIFRSSRLSKLSKHTRLCPTCVAVCIGFFPVSKKMGFSLDIFCCSYQHTFCLHVLTPKRIPDDFRMTYASLPLNTLYIHTNKVHLHPSRIQTHLRAWDIFFLKLLLFGVSLVMAETCGKLFNTIYRPTEKSEKLWIREKCTLPKTWWVVWLATWATTNTVCTIRRVFYLESNIS